jgi:hypothetical protein
MCGVLAEQFTLFKSSGLFYMCLFLTSIRHLVRNSKQWNIEISKYVLYKLDVGISLKSQRSFHILGTVEEVTAKSNYVNVNNVCVCGKVCVIT